MAAVVDADEVVIIGGAVAPVIGDDFVVPAGKLYCGLCGPNGVFDTPSQIANHKRGHWHAGKVAGRPQTSEVGVFRVLCVCVCTAATLTLPLPGEEARAQTSG